MATQLTFGDCTVIDVDIFDVTDGDTADVSSSLAPWATRIHPETLVGVATLGLRSVVKGENVHGMCD